MLERKSFGSFRYSDSKLTLPRGGSNERRARGGWFLSRSPSSALLPTFLREGSPTKLDYRKKKKGPLIPIPPLKDLALLVALFGIFRGDTGQEVIARVWPCQWLATPNVAHLQKFLDEPSSLDLIDGL